MSDKAGKFFITESGEGAGLFILDQILKRGRKDETEKMLIGICENREVYITAVMKAADAWRKKKKVSGAVLRICRSAWEFLDDWEKGSDFDVLFIDVDLPRNGGLHLLREIRKRDPYLPVVLLSDGNADPKDGYRLSAFRYLTFPLRPSEVFECLNEVFRCRCFHANRYLCVKYREIHIRLPVRDILRITSLGHRMEVIMVGGGLYDVMRRDSMEKLCSGLPKRLFCRCHHSCIVNLLYVTAFTGTELIQADGSRIQIGKKYRKQTEERLVKLFRETETAMNTEKLSP